MQTISVPHKNAAKSSLAIMFMMMGVLSDLISGIAKISPPLSDTKSLNALLNEKFYWLWDCIRIISSWQIFNKPTSAKKILFIIATYKSVREWFDGFAKSHHSVVHNPEIEIIISHLLKSIELKEKVLHEELKKPNDEVNLQTEDPEAKLEMEENPIDCKGCLLPPLKLGKDNQE